MAVETVVHPETSARESLAMDAVIEIGESAQLILNMLDEAGSTEPGQAPIRGLAIRLLDLADVALGLVDYESSTVEEMEATFRGAKRISPTKEATHA